MAHLPLLLTRPVLQSRRFAAQAAQRFGQGPVVVSPVLEIVPTATLPDLSGYDGVILTSANAVSLPGMRWPKGLSAWCVGGATAAAAGAAGLAVQSADGALEDLLALIKRARPAGRLLHLRGVHTKGDPAAVLSAAGIPTDATIVYDQQLKMLNSEAVGLLARPGPVLIPVFSSRSASALAPMLEKAAACLLVAAISPAVARSLAVHSAARIQVATRPDTEAILDRLAALQDDLRA